MNQQLPEPFRLSLWNGQAPVGAGQIVADDAFITVHRPVKANGMSVVICPGGGYGALVSGPEGHGIAKWLNQHGIVGVVLEYRLPKGNSYIPLADAQRAIKTVRARGAEWGCDPARIGIIGFSAGGHLASTAATHFESATAQPVDSLAGTSARPDFAILVYPVITMGPLTHEGSKLNLLGPAPTPDAVELFSNEKQVTTRTPPTFLAHASDDGVVPVLNSRMFYEALQAHKVATEFLELPTGNHGLNGYQGPMWDAWQAQSLRWLAQTIQ